MHKVQLTVTSLIYEFAIEEFQQLQSQSTRQTRMEPNFTASATQGGSHRQLVDSGYGNQSLNTQDNASHGLGQIVPGSGQFAHYHAVEGPVLQNGSESSSSGSQHERYNTVSGATATFFGGFPDEDRKVGFPISLNAQQTSLSRHGTVSDAAGVAMPTTLLVDQQQTLPIVQVVPISTHFSHEKELSRRAASRYRAKKRKEKEDKLQEIYERAGEITMIQARLKRLEELHHDMMRDQSRRCENCDR